MEGEGVHANALVPHPPGPLLLQTLVQHCRKRLVQYRAKDDTNQLPGFKDQYTPLNNYLFDLLKEPLLEHLGDERRYETCFDRFEFFLAAVHADLRDKDFTRRYGDASEGIVKFWGPIGRFGWKGRVFRKTLFPELTQEVTEAGIKWPPLVAGMFGGSVERFLEVHKGITELVEKIGWFY